MISQKLLDRFYGDPRFQGTRIFYGMIRTHTEPNSCILNLGAGPATKDPTRIFKGEVAEVTGADIDPVVLENDELDHAVVIDGVNLPFDDGHFELVYSDFVLEHVERPRPFLKEVRRVLKPGGSYFFRTPNLFHYVALGSHLTPQWVHERWANPMRGLDERAHDPWPTFYRVNTPRKIRQFAREAGFGRADLKLVEMEPSYLQFHTVPFLVGVAYERLVNSTNLLAGLRGNIFGRLVRE